jgi:LysR family transcriptional activator of nhaA
MAQTSAAPSLNFHHVVYFWAIAEEGSLLGAARRLNLTHSTLSKQLRELEERLGAPLFERRGRSLALTPFGREVREYAADIARIGTELVAFAEDRATPRHRRLRIGVVSSLPKTLVHALLAPAFDSPDGARAVLRQLPRTELFDALRGEKLDVALVDELAPPSSHTPLHAHALGETELLWYGTKALARRLRDGFPRSLDRAPMVLPSHSTPLRRQLDQWLVEHNITNAPTFEVDDAGILRAFGVAGRGVFPVRAALRSELDDLPGMAQIGPCEGVRERYFLLTVERKLRRPAVIAVLEAARHTLLAPSRAKGARALTGRAR